MGTGGASNDSCIRFSGVLEIGRPTFFLIFVNAKLFNEKSIHKQTRREDDNKAQLFASEDASFYKNGIYNLAARWERVK